MVLEGKCVAKQKLILKINLTLYQFGKSISQDLFLFNLWRSDLKNNFIRLTRRESEREFVCEEIYGITHKCNLMKGEFYFISDRSLYSFAEEQQINKLRF